MLVVETIAEISRGQVNLGPKLPFTMAPSFCGSSPHSCRSLQAHDLRGEQRLDGGTEPPFDRTSRLAADSPK